MPSHSECAVFRLPTSTYDKFDGVVGVERNPADAGFLVHFPILSPVIYKLSGAALTRESTLHSQGSIVSD